jgi:hypothetical protein
MEGRGEGSKEASRGGCCQATSEPRVSREGQEIILCLVRLLFDGPRRLLWGIHSGLHFGGVGPAVQPVRP